MALANLLAMPPRRQPAAPTGMTPSRQVLAQRVPRSEALVRALMEGGTKSEPIETGLELIGKLAQVWAGERGQRKRDEYDREQTGRAASDMAAALAGYGSFPTVADIEAQRPRSGGDIPPMDIRPPGASVPGGTQLPNPQQGAAGWQPDMDPDVTGGGAAAPQPRVQPTSTGLRINLGSDTMEGVTPQATALLNATQAAAAQMGITLEVVGANDPDGSSHVSHQHGTEFDVVGYNADGSRWTDDQRVQVATAARQAGANRFGLYDSGSLHMGLGYDGAPQNVAWGPGGRTGGVPLDAFDAVERPFVQSLRGGGAPSPQPQGTTRVAQSGGGYMFQEPPRDSTGGAVYPQPTGGPNTQGIMAALASPYLPEVYQQVGSQLLSQAMTPPDPTADLQEINGQLVNVRTGEVVGDYRDQPAAADYDSANDANGVRRYIEGPNMGQPVPGFDGPRTPTPMNPTDLRKEIQGLDSYNQWSASASVYNSMVEAAGRNSRASDLNLVYGLAKIFDPTSVVRESEQVMVQNTAAVPDYIIGIINRWNGDRALQPGTRQAIMEEAYSRVHAYEGQFERDLNQYRGIVERNALNPADILPNISPVMPWVPTEAPTTTSDPRVPPGANYLMQPDSLGPQQGFVPRAPAATALPTLQTVPPPPAAAPAPPQGAPSAVWEFDAATGTFRLVQ